MDFDEWERKQIDRFMNIPQEIRDIPQWVCWMWVKRDGKKTKKPLIPYSPKYGACANNSKTWGTFEQALNTFLSFPEWIAGIGWEFGNSGYFGVDLDHCAGVEDRPDFRNEFIDALQSYNEISASGTGVHILCKGTLPPNGRKKGDVEMYCTGRYFVFTGNICNKQYTQIGERTEEIKPLHKKYFPKSYVVSVPHECVPVSVEDGDLLNMARDCRNGALFQMLYEGMWENVYPSQSNADMALCCILAYWTGCEAARMDRIFRGSGLMRRKWDERHGALTYGQMTIQKAIDGCKETYSPANSIYR